jgi:hypothetical protein
MKKLADILLTSEQSADVVAAVVQLIESQVASRGGLKGVGLRTGLGMAKAIRPDILPKAVQRLLPEFAAALDPLYQQWAATGTPDFGAFLRLHPAEAGASLLAVADTRVRQASSAVQTIYGRLRGSAETEVQSALPALSDLLQRFLPVPAP